MVVVGSSLLVAVNGFGAGFTEFFNKQFSNLAPNILFVSSVQQQDQGSAHGGSASGGGSITVSPAISPKISLNTVVENRISALPSVDEVIPSYQGQVNIQSHTESKLFSILSMNPTKLFVVAPTLELLEGSTISPNDPSSIIISENIAFPPGESKPFISLGQTATVIYSYIDPQTGGSKEESKNFVVKGVMESTGNPTIDNAAIISKESGNALLQRSGKFDSFFVVAKSTNLVDGVEEQIRRLYGNDIGITTVKAILKTIGEFTGGITAFLISIAIISLIVGAVGIITTLYTSVVERIKEIGTLKAIGANNSQIMALFIVEALLVGIFGASLGLIVGIGMGYILVHAGSSGQSLAPLYLVPDMITVWIISIVLSLVAGLYPAWKASRYLPIEALKSQ